MSGLTGSQPTRAQVDAAIETLNSSYSYDPPERWASAYHLLQRVRDSMKTSKRRFAWIHLLSIAAFVLFAAAAFYLLFTGQYDGTPYVVAMGGMLVVARFLAERRFPILKLELQVNGACRKFDDLPNEHSNDPT